MTEFVLFGVIVVLAALLYLRERENRIERAKLLNALISKNATEMASLEFVDRVKPQDTKPVPQDLLSTADMSDEDFDKHIEEQLKNG